jgi:hypothetical protein
MKNFCEQREYENLHAMTRRQFFRDCGVGMGKIALASLLCGGMARTAQASAPAHFAPKAKRVIQLFMSGAPSQLELFDYKPALLRYDGQPVPAEVVKDQRYAFIRPDAALMAGRYRFSRHGQSGAELSEMLPYLGEVADDIAIVRTVHTTQFNHAPAEIFMNTGSPLFGRPSMGAWVTYGLGTESDDLPGFVVLQSGEGSRGGAHSYGCGFMPTEYQGVPFRSKGAPILNVQNPHGVDDALQRDTIALITEMNRHKLGAVGDPEIAARVSAYELAYRMQSSAPELVDLSGESQETFDLYGAVPGEASFANNVLLARRLVERGARFVSCYHGGWDAHGDVAGNVRHHAGLTDRACAALIKDLKQRGMLDETLVIWGGEFGRTPMVESNAVLGRNMGRDHHPQAFTMWFAGGGIKPGQTIGQTDDIGFHIAERPVHVHDIQATILHLLGLDHTRLTYHFQGRDFRLTDVHGELVTELIA